MTTPSFLQWRTFTADNSVPLKLPPQSVQARMLSCLATLVSNTNPDGTTRGT
jgi:hypothetical protein